MTLINISDLVPVRHGEAVLYVDCKRVKTRGDHPLSGYRGFVRVEFPKNPTASYIAPVEGDFLRITDADATADAIALRKDLIAMNKVTPQPTTSPAFGAPSNPR